MQPSSSRRASAASFFLTKSLSRCLQVMHGHLQYLLYMAAVRYGPIFTVGTDILKILPVCPRTKKLLPCGKQPLLRDLHQDIPMILSLVYGPASAPQVLYR